MERLRTGLGDADAHIAALELGAGQVERLLQAVERAEFDVAKALGLAIELVLDDAHVGDLAVGEEVVDIALGGVEGEVAQMGRVRGLRGEGELLAGREAALGCGGELACAYSKQRAWSGGAPKLSVRAELKPPPEPYEGLSPP